jgi:hypothetical protein
MLFNITPTCVLAPSTLKIPLLLPSRNHSSIRHPCFFLLFPCSHSGRQRNTSTHLPLPPFLSLDAFPSLTKTSPTDLNLAFPGSRKSGPSKTSITFMSSDGRLGLISLACLTTLAPPLLTGGCYIFGLIPPSYPTGDAAKNASRYLDLPTQLSDMAISTKTTAFAGVPWVFEGFMKVLKNESDEERKVHVMEAI